VDRAVFGVTHLYHKDYDFDPEGLPGTLPAIVNVIFGYLAGVYVRKHGASRLVAIRYLGAGVALFAAALALNPFFPIGKKLWTSSFVLLTVGVSRAVKRADQRYDGWFRTLYPGSPAAPQPAHPAPWPAAPVQDQGRPHSGGAGIPTTGIPPMPLRGPSQPGR
jgi:hypothetical protein